MDKKLPKMYPLEEENNGLLSNSLLPRLRLFNSHTYSLVLNRISLRIKQRSSGGIEDRSGFRLLEVQVSKFGKHR